MEVFINKRLFTLSCLAGLARLQNTMSVVSVVAATQMAGFTFLQSSITAGSLFAAAALSAVLKGRAVDRRGRGIIPLQATFLLGAFLFLIVAIAIFPWWVAVLGATLVGVIRFNPAMLQQGLWSKYHQCEEKLGRATAWENLLSFVAQTVGPLLAALIIWLISGLAALVFAALITVGSMFLWGLLAPREFSHKTEVAGSAEITQRLFGITSLVAAAALLAFASGMMQGLILGNFSSSSGALMIACYTLGAGLASLYFFRKKFPQNYWKNILTLSPLSLFLIAVTFKTSFLPLALLLGGMLYSSGLLSANLKIKALAPKARIHEALSVLLTAVPLALSAGIFLSGLLLEKMPADWQSVALAVPLALVLLSFATLRAGDISVRQRLGALFSSNRQ